MSYLHPVCAECQQDHIEGKCIGKKCGGCIHQTSYPEWQPTNERTMVEIQDTQKEPPSFYIDEHGNRRPVRYSRTVYY